MKRFFLDRDGSGHWYIVPVDIKSEWSTWCALNEDDERAWTSPDGAIEVGGAPSLVTFTDPTV